ncbi:MAG TPA: hypothetical protein VF265_03805 [Nevskiaceae bacterium]
MIHQLMMIAALAAALCTGSAFADVVQLPASEDAAASSVATPRRGATMEQVLRAFGAPTDRHAPVGGQSPQQPPITRWDYPYFSVFFEHRMVIDSVIPGQPPKVYHTGSLQRAS